MLQYIKKKKKYSTTTTKLDHQFTQLCCLPDWMCFNNSWLKGFMMHSKNSFGLKVSFLCYLNENQQIKEKTWSEGLMFIYICTQTWGV